MKLKKRRIHLNKLRSAASALAIGLAVPATALAEEQTIVFDIPAQPLSQALAEFSRQSQVNVVAPTALTREKTSNAIAGDMAPATALEALVGDAPMVIEVEDDGSIILVQQQSSLQKGRSFRVAQLVDGPVQRELNSESEETTVENITVTGTLIRGANPESSPLQIYDRDDILSSGVTSTEQFIRLLPQSFGGGSSEFVPIGLPNDRSAGSNNTAGASANLRGLGSSATLVLLNGNRLAPTSQIGDFVDLSMIPISAIERIDVLSDGASSIYGGDAVAGVINFVLRDDFEGAETSARYGAVTSGNLNEFRVSQSVGAAWEDGNILAAYEFFDRDSLSLADRPAINLFPARVADTELPDRTLYHLLPHQARHSAMLSARQELSPAFSLSATGLYSSRSSDQTTFGANGTVDYSGSSSKNLTAAVGADYQASPDWAVSADITYSEIRNYSIVQELQRLSGPLSPDIEIDTDSSLWSADLQINGDLFELPGGRVRIALGGQYREEEFANERLGERITSSGSRSVAAVYGEALIPIVTQQNATPGINRLELNVSGRLDDYSDFGSSINPKVGALWSPVEGLNLRGSYSTSFAPPSLGRSFALNRYGQVLPYQFMLDFIGADYPDPALAGTDYMQVFGTATDLEPETSRTYTLGFDSDVEKGAHQLSVSGTYYDIRFENRLGATPMPQNQTDILAPHVAIETPDALPEGSVIFFPSDETVDALIATFNLPIQLFLVTSLDNIGVINMVNVIRNLAITETSGLDFQIDYFWETGAGRFGAGLNANYIIDFTQQAASTTPAVDAINTLYNPVDLKLRGRLSYSNGGFAGNLFVNYTDSYRSDNTDLAQPIDAWTTVDVTASYNFGADDRWLRGAGLSLSVSNLFDNNPPSTPNNGVYSISGYDPTNASPLGRFVAIELRKAF